MNRNMIELISEFSKSATPTTFNEFKMTLDTRILVLFQRKAECNHKEAYIMIEEIRKQYNEYFSRMSEVHREEIKLKMNIVRLIEILMDHRTFKLKFEDFDFMELKFLMKPNYDRKIVILYNGIVTDMFQMITSQRYLRIARAIYDNHMKYGLDDNIRSQKGSRVTHNQNKVIYLEYFLRQSLKALNGSLDSEEEKALEEFDIEKSEILRSIIPKNMKFKYDPLPSKLVETFEEAQEISKLIMKIIMENSGIHQASVGHMRKDLGFWQGEKQNLIFDHFPEFHRGIVHHLAGMFHPQQSMKIKMLNKSLDHLKNCKTNLFSKQYYDTESFLKEVIIETDTVYEDLIEAKYEVVKKLPYEQRKEQNEKLKILVEERITHGEYRIKKMKEEGYIPTSIIEIYDNMAKWTRYVIMDIPRSKKFEEYALLCKMFSCINSEQNRLNNPKRNKEETK